MIFNSVIDTIIILLLMSYYILLKPWKKEQLKSSKLRIRYRLLHE